MEARKEEPKDDHHEDEDEEGDDREDDDDEEEEDEPDNDDDGVDGDDKTLISVPSMIRELVKYPMRNRDAKTPMI